ncbi:MAG: HNH endonuclease [Thermoplasmatales archaeon]
MLKPDSEGNVDNKVIKELGIRYGQRGIITKNLTHINEAVALSILSNGKDYSDRLGDGSLEYDFPDTSIKGEDEREISAMIAAMNYKLPIFVILVDKFDDQKRKVMIGLVKDYDQARNKFLVDLLSEFPSYKDTYANDMNIDNQDFYPYEFEEMSNKQLVKVRRNQTKFRYGVLKRYGKICSVCDFDIEEAIEAAHIVPKESNGTDDARNGITLCANHHRLFDTNFFAFDKESKILIRKDFNAKDLGITKSDLKHLRNLPHQKALEWRENNFRHR